MNIYWKQFFELAIVHFLAVVVPGPDFIVTVRQSIRFGRKIGVATALGIGTGISVHVGYTLLGVAVLFKVYPILLRGVSFLGAGYLCYLGWKLIFSHSVTSNIDPLGESAGNFSNISRSESWGGAFYKGFFTNATNPKATLFFLAIFTTIVSPATPMDIQIGYGLWMCSVNAIWFTVIALIFGVGSIRSGFLRFGKNLELIMGAILIAFAVRLFFVSIMG